ncbi:MAG: 1-deoxy-D-xylulose-5-phosphate reductoisomerase, partial [Mariprofundaceae bacterium]
VSESRFPAMRLVRQVMQGGDALAIAMNAATEVANEAFRAGRLAFTAIVPLVEQVVERTADHNAADLDEVWAIDAEARRMAREMLSS